MSAETGCAGSGRDLSCELGSDSLEGGLRNRAELTKSRGWVGLFAFWRFFLKVFCSHHLRPRSRCSHVPPLAKVCLEGGNPSSVSSKKTWEGRAGAERRRLLTAYTRQDSGPCLTFAIRDVPGLR